MAETRQTSSEIVKECLFGTAGCGPTLAAITEIPPEASLDAIQQAAHMVPGGDVAVAPTNEIVHEIKSGQCSDQTNQQGTNPRVTQSVVWTPTVNLQLKFWISRF